MMWEACAEQDQRHGRRDRDGREGRRLRVRRAARAAGRSTHERRRTASATDHARSMSSRRRRCASWSTVCSRSLADGAPAGGERAEVSRLPHGGADPRRTATLFDDNWIYIHDPSVKVGRIQNFKSWSPEMVPDPTMTCYGLEYFCFEGDGLWNSPDADLIELAKRRAGEDRPGASRRTSSTAPSCASRRRIPVYDDDYATQRRRRSARELEQRFPTLHLVGRNGMHKYNNQDHAMMTAMLSRARTSWPAGRSTTCGT